MPKDIRSYFTAVGAGKKKDTKNDDIKVQKKKRVAVISDSDDDDIIIVKKPKPIPENKSKYFTEDAKKTAPQKKTPELKPAKAADVFGCGAVKRSTKKTAVIVDDEVEKNKKDKKVPKCNVEESEDLDIDFEATLSQLDEIEARAMEQLKKESEPVKEQQLTRKSPRKSSDKKVSSPDSKISARTGEDKNIKPSVSKRSKLSNGLCTKEDKFHHRSLTLEKKDSSSHASEKSPKSKERASKPSSVKKAHGAQYVSDSDEDDKKEPTHKTEDKAKSKEPITKEAKKTTPPKAKTKEEDEPYWAHDPAEKRRLSAIGYQRYLQREGPKHLGMKEVPKATPNCLKGLVFVITGVLDSIERDAAAVLIQECGGRVTCSVSRNTSYVVVGEDAGPSKISKAEQFGTHQINEDELFDLIRTKSGLPAKTEDGDVNKREEKTKDNEKEESKHKTTVPSPKKGKHNVTATENSKHSFPPSSTKGVTKPSESKGNIKPPESKGITKQPESKGVTKLPESKGITKSPESKGVTKSPESKGVTKPPESKVENFYGKQTNDSHELNQSSSQGSSSSQSITSSQDAKAQSKLSLLWVDKYRPTSLKNIIGQQGDRSNVKRLLQWLLNWHKNQFGGKKLVKPSPWAKADDGAYFKAALLSGPPGVGKTTTAHLVCKELGFDFVEFNASDTRSKKLLHEEVSELLSTKSLNDYFKSKNNSKTTSKHVLVMDEVDGMAGNEDRGGIQELIQLIKNSKVPIICMCNDVHHQKIRSLLGYCFDLRFQKPRVEQIRGAMQSVCFKEGLKIPADVLTDMITGSNQDVRQVLHHLSMYAVNSNNQSSVKAACANITKHVKLGPWDVLKKVFSAEEHKTMSINDKSDLFFHDYSIAPLFVQENYLSVLPEASKNNTFKRLELVAQAADSICMGDIVDRSIRSKNAWSLLPAQAMFASVIPGNILEGVMTSQINFPSWLGKNSRRGQIDRLLQELHSHMRLSMSGNKQALNLDYIPRLCGAIARPLQEMGSEGVPESVEVLQAYNLLRSDMDSIMELAVWPGGADPMSSVDSKVKAALTRTYNKDLVLPYSNVANITKKKPVSFITEEDEDVGEEEEEEDDDITGDAMIKAKKRPAAKNTSESGPSTSKRGRGEDRGNGSKRGRGRGKK